MAPQAQTEHLHLMWAEPENWRWQATLRVANLLEFGGI